MRAPVFLVLAALVPTGVAAQRLTNPSPQFGASSIPHDAVWAHLGVSFDKFTPNGKATDPGMFNGIDRTIGLNFLNYSIASRSTRWPSVIYGGTLQLGYGHDQPTKGIQDRIHIWADSGLVESIDPRDGVFDWAANFEANQWSPWGLNTKRFVGAGFAVGTVNQELYFQSGTVWKPKGNASTASVAALVRVGFPMGGDAFPGEHLASRYEAFETEVRVPARQILGSRGPRWWRWVARGLPDFGFVARIDTGFFADAEGNGIPQGFGAPRLVWGDEAFVFEFWNDYFGGEFQDKGPTGGGRIYGRFWNLPGVLAWLLP